MMKKILFLITIISCFSFSIPEKETYKLIIIIDGLKETSGTVEVALYNTEDTFLSDEENYRWTKKEVSGNSVKIVFDDLPKGSYAFAGYHDENNNGEMDKSFGVPKEGFFFSNNAKASLSAPDYEDALFQIVNDTEQKVKLQFVF